MDETIPTRAGEGQRALDGLRAFSGAQGAGAIAAPSCPQVGGEEGQGGVRPAPDEDELARLRAIEAIEALKRRGRGTQGRGLPAGSAQRESNDDPVRLQAIEALKAVRQRAAAPAAATSADTAAVFTPPSVVRHRDGESAPQVAKREDAASPRPSTRERRRVHQHSAAPSIKARNERAQQARNERAQQQRVVTDEEDPDAWRHELQPTLPRTPRPPLNRLQRRISTAILREEAVELAAQLRRELRYDWMTADDVGRSPEELASIDRRRNELEQRIRRADGSHVEKLGASVFSAAELKTASYMARDDASGELTSCEWGKLWRWDRLAANAALHACWGIREDGTAVRDWTSPRARRMFVVAWLSWRAARAGTSLTRDHGFLLVRGVPVTLYQVVCAPYGTAKMCRNTFSGVHRSGSVANPDQGYLRALELSHFFEAVQFGDRRSAPRQCNTYRLRVTVAEDARVIDRSELALRTVVRNWWQRLADVGQIVVTRLCRPQVDHELRAAILQDVLPAPA